MAKNEPTHILSDTLLVTIKKLPLSLSLSVSDPRIFLHMRLYHLRNEFSYQHHTVLTGYLPGLQLLYTKPLPMNTKKFK